MTENLKGMLHYKFGLFMAFLSLAQENTYIDYQPVSNICGVQKL